MTEKQNKVAWAHLVTTFAGMYNMQKNKKEIKKKFNNNKNILHNYKPTLHPSDTTNQLTFSSIETEKETKSLSCWNYQYLSNVACLFWEQEELIWKNGQRKNHLKLLLFKS